MQNSKNLAIVHSKTEPLVKKQAYVYNVFTICLTDMFFCLQASDMLHRYQYTQKNSKPVF